MQVPFTLLLPIRWQQKINFEMFIQLMQNAADTTQI
jgi:hypothetical protein